jgi:tRNA-2-methylthio-N6-dimethylallyladenosine synthase
VKYHVWTIGCQMNVADSRRLESALEGLGAVPAASTEDADIVVLNTCVVRQSAEDRCIGRLTSLRPLKERRPHAVVAVMGCLVGVRHSHTLHHRFPWVDVFLPPSEPQPLIRFLAERGFTDEARAMEITRRQERAGLQSSSLLLPARDDGLLVSAYVPAVLGCSQGCTYCIIPYRRGPERSRPFNEVIDEARALAAQGVKEVTLLGQIVDRYGLDLAGGARLESLLERLHEIEQLERIRFLTSHPAWITDELLTTVARLPKVVEHIEVPVQAGDDEVLKKMRRGYSSDDYRRLVGRIREQVPGASIATDVIVGFPGETEGQFQRTCDLLEELRLDKVHIARYSPRPQTVAARSLVDDVPPDEKERRRRALDLLQERLLGEMIARRCGQTVEVLVEGMRKGRWFGRTRNDRLVFFEAEGNWQGALAQVRVNWAGPWSLVGELAP